MSAPYRLSGGSARKASLRDMGDRMSAKAKSIDLTALVDLLRPGMTVYVPGVSGESLAFYDALKAAPHRAAGVRFVGVHFPGINHTDYIHLDPTTRQRAYFM